MKLLVCGGRGYFDAIRIDRTLDLLAPTLVIHGCARGADALAANWAVKRGVAHQCFKADWSAYGKGAGMIRNRQMLAEGKPDMVAAFPGGRGTADMVQISQEAGLHVLVFT